MEKLNLLVVEDNPSDFSLVRLNFARAGYVAECVRVDTLNSLREKLASRHWDAVLMDYNLPHVTFADAVSIVHECDANLPVILVSGSILEEKALAVLQQGAWDYVAKDHLLRLPNSVQRAIEQARTKKILNDAERELKIVALAFESNDSIVITDADGVIERVNNAFCKSSGLLAEQAVGKRFPHVMAPDIDHAYFDALWGKIRRTGKWEGEVSLPAETQSKTTYWLNVTGIYDDASAKQHFVVIAHDISARKTAEEEIARLAFYDPLTSLPNRRMLIDRLRLALSVARRNGHFGALMFVDLDHFKNINDSLGHECGDALLVEVGRRLSDCVRVNDMVARLGGDEFVVMLENLAGPMELVAAHVQSVADKLRSEVGRECVIRGQYVYVTPSIGIALFGDAEKSVDDLLRWADLAMYQAKGAGRNSAVFFDPQMQAVMLRRTKLETDLRKAITRHEFRLVYQPKVDRAGLVTGFEALARWKSEHGEVLPSDFIPVAEDSGLILPLGDQILEMACQQFLALKARGKTDLSIAINVSLRQFRNPSFCEEIESRLKYFEIDPRLLILELTESILADRMNEVAEKMHRLKASGVRFSLDDFGTGYASLSYLKGLPFDQVKIDRSFVSDLSTNANDPGLVRAIIAMAHTLGLDVVAEGVETVEQWKFLLDEGCDGAQGYLFSRPLEVDALMNSLVL